MHKKLNKEFYDRCCIDVAKDLLGKYLVHLVGGEVLIGKIVETEAYMGPLDKASHAFNNKKTKRTEIMFGPPGFAYVYHIYGMYYCMNVVVESENKPEAVLIRALEPVEGLKKMAELRYNKKVSDCDKKELIRLTNGPGKLCKAMNIEKVNNGADLCSESFYICDAEKAETFEIVSATRINIHYAEEAIHYPWRFYIKDNNYISAK